ncbi:helix-turn-helix transcriptional regulator [Nocardioides sp.]|uniref:helix-turn-helix transcriptional regulator n=1 Tax=Nocardioides sp. TaxID=35761 RepID=UPI0039E6F78E
MSRRGGDLLERDAQLALATTLLTRAAGGQGGAVCLLGSAGVGKTAVLRRLAAAAPGAGLAVLRATAGQLESQAPFGVVRQLLDRALVALPPDELARVAQGPARLAADFVQGVTTAREDGLTVLIEQSRMLNSLFWLIDGLARLPRASGLLLTVDDAQWADEASLLFLAHLLGRIEDLPVLVVVAAREVRSDRRSPALAAIVAHAQSHTSALPPLSEPGVHAYLRAAYDDGLGVEVGHGFAGACAQITGGNPFLLTELTRLLIQQGVPPDDASVERVRQVTPPSVVDAVVQRLTALDEEERALARAVATLQETTVRHAAALADLDLTRASTAADRLRDAALLSDGPGLGFRHALLEAAVIEATGASAQAQLHRAAARLLAEEPDALHRAAAHLLAAEGVGDEWSVDLLSRAARDAIESGAPQAAVTLLERAVAEPPTADRLGDLLLRLGRAQLATSDPACVPTLLRAKEALTDVVALVECAQSLAFAFSFAGFNDQAVAELRGAYDLLGPEHGDLRLVVEAGLIQASLLVPGEVSAARERLAALPELTGATPGERLLLIQLASNANAVGAPASQVRDYALRALVGGPHREQWLGTPQWTWVRVALASSGEYEMARELASQGLEQAASEVFLPGFLLASFVHGTASWWMGDLATSEADFRVMMERAHAVPAGRMMLSLATALLAQVLVEQGSVEEALRIIERTGDVDEKLLPGSIHLLRARGLVFHYAGEHTRALAEADQCRRQLQAIDSDSPGWSTWRSIAVLAHWALGDVAQARKLAAEELELAQRCAVPRVLGVAYRLAGQVAEGDGLASLEQAVTILAASQARLEEGRARIVYGAALRRAGRRVDAREMLLAGRALAASAGARPLVAEAESELAAAGVRTRSLDVTGAAALTASESRVCELAVRGLRNREIAQRLFITPKTVEVHLSRAYRKLGIAGRDELTAALAEN